MSAAIKELFEAKNLSKKSVEMYLRNLKYLNGGDVQDLKFLDNQNKIIACAKLTQAGKQASNNTYKNRLTTILAALTTMGHGDGANYEFYKQKYDEAKDVLTKIAISGELSETEKAAWKPAADIKDIFQQVKAKAQGPKATREEISDYFLLSLWLTMAPRRLVDYTAMKLLRGTPPKNLSNQSNYFIVDQNKMIFNVYKTSSSYGTETVNVADNAEFLEAFKTYSTILKKSSATAKYTLTALLQFLDGTGWSGDNIRNRLYAILGEGIGVTMLRKILASDGAPSKEQMEKLMTVAAGQSHTIGSHIRYYMKNVPADPNAPTQDITHYVKDMVSRPMKYEPVIVDGKDYLLKPIDERDEEEIMGPIVTKKVRKPRAKAKNTVS